MLEGWAEFNFKHEITNSHDICTQFIWYNSNICIGNKPFIFLTTFQSGLRYIHQLYDDNGMLHSFDDLCNNFDITRYQHIQIWYAIPIEWKRMITVQGIQRDMLFYNYDLLLNEYKISARIYNKLIFDENAISSRKNRWEHKLSVTFTNKKFFTFFKNIYTTTICTKFRDFQYRLLTGSLVTNRMLLLWKIKDSDLCTLCLDAIEDEIHLFCQCSRIQSLWLDLKEFIRNNDNHDVYSILDWSDMSIITSLVHPRGSHVVNFFITIVKQMIYRYRCFGALPNSVSVEEEINNIYDIELQVATMNNKMRRHCEKWSCFKDIEYTDENQLFVENYIQNM